MTNVATIADMSAPQIQLVPTRTTRTEQNRQAKQRQRERQRQAGVVTFHIELPASDAQMVDWLKTAQSGDVESFLARALCVGAKFVYNSGNVRGGKKRIKGACK